MVCGGVTNEYSGPITQKSLLDTRFSMNQKVLEDLQAIVNTLTASHRNVKTLSLSRGMDGLRDKTSSLCKKIKDDTAGAEFTDMVTEVESDLEMTAPDRELLLSELDRMSAAIERLAHSIS